MPTSVTGGTGSGDAGVSDPEVDKWGEKLAASQPGRAETYLRHLAHFAQATRTTPSRLRQLAKDDVRRLVQEFVAAEKRAGRAADHVKTSLEVVKLWLEDHGWQLAEWPEWV